MSLTNLPQRIAGKFMNRLALAYWEAPRPQYRKKGTKHIAQDTEQPDPSHIRAQQTLDAVYTWVDSTDPAWRAKHSEALRHISSVRAEAIAEERFLSRHELRYSLRSLHDYAPFVRNIYIVTDGQVPAWLNASHPKIRVIDHREIFPDLAVLPTFNSHAIEACLHRIPGLSRLFLYLNDDVFLGRTVLSNDFVDENRAIQVRTSPTLKIAVRSDTEESWMWANLNSINAVKRDLGCNRLQHPLRHTPHLLDRVLMEDVENRYTELFNETRASKFRSRKNIAPITLFSAYALGKCRAIEPETRAEEIIHVTLGSQDMGRRLLKIKRERPKFYCLNSTHKRDVSIKRQGRILANFLESMHPRPSPFEL